MSRQTELNYYRQLKQVARLVREDVDANIVPLVKQLAPEYTADGWSDTITSAINQLLTRWLGAFARRQAETIASQFVQTAAKDNARSFAINLYGGDTQLQEYLSAASYQNAKLIQSIPAQYLEQVQNIVMTNMRNGMRPSYIEEALVKQFGITERRAKLIARDQTSKIQGDMNRIRQTNSGIEYFKWITSQDERVRHSHVEVAKRDVGYGEGVFRWDDLPVVDGVPTFPGQPINCFPGTSPLNVFYGAEKAFRHWFSGELTVLVTESGERLECTPNHPVLTDKGFVAAHLLNVGDNIVYVPQQAFNVSEKDAHSSNIVFGEFFNAAQLIGVSDKPVRALGGEFHGDISANEEIEVIDFNWVLPDEFDSALGKNFFELFLTRAEEVFGLVDAPCDSNLTSVVKGLTFAPDSVVSSACKLLSFVSAGFTHPNEHRLAAVGLLYSRLVEDASDDVARSVQFFGNCFDTLTSVDARHNLFKRYILAIVRSAFGFGDFQTPGANSFTECIGTNAENFTNGFDTVTIKHQLVRIIDKTFREFSGHVYNLQMERGLFVSHNFAVSNCRCVARPVTAAAVERYKAKKS